MYEAGDLDYTKIPSAAVPKYEGKDQTTRDGSVDYYYFNCNGENAAMNNKNFRLALNYAFNRNANNKLVNNGVHAPSNSIAFSGLKGVEKTYGEESNLTSYPLDGDKAKAEEYLNAALKELGLSKPSDITVTITTTDNDSSKKQAEACQEMWKKDLGINVEINQITYAETLKRQQTGEFDIIWGGWVSDYDDPYSYLELYKSDCAYNYSRYKNEEVDKILNATQTETDAAKRMEMLHQAEQLILDDAPLLPQNERIVHYLVDEDVKGLKNYYAGVNLDWIYVDIEQ